MAPNAAGIVTHPFAYAKVRVEDDGRDACPSKVGSQGHGGCPGSAAAAPATANAIRAGGLHARRSSSINELAVRRHSPEAREFVLRLIRTPIAAPRPQAPGTDTPGVSRY